MRFEEGNQAGKQRGVARAAAQLVCLDSGQRKEPLCPPFFGEGRRKRGKR